MHPPPTQSCNIPIYRKTKNYLERTGIYQYTKNPNTNPRWFISISILVLQQMLVFWFFGILVYCSFGWAVGGSGPMCCQGAWIHIWSHHKTPASPGGPQQRIDPLSPTAHPKLQYTNVQKNSENNYLGRPPPTAYQSCNIPIYQKKND